MKPRKKLSSLATLLGAAMLLLPPASGHADSLQVAAVSPVAPSAARFQAAHFAEPLVPIGPTSASEDNALADAVAAYERRVRADDVSSLIAFLVAHPKSGWVSALQTNIGLSYLHYGYFSRAIEAWRAAWIAGKNATDPNARALVDRAVGELTRLYASLGHTEQLSTLFDEIGDRAVTGSATEAIQVAREQLALVEKDPRHLFICGPVALRALMLAKGAAAEQVDFLQWYRAGRDGTNLAEVARLADKTKLDYRLIYRAPGQHVPVPSIVHWKVGHFAAVVGENNGFLRIEDPVFFGHPHWIAPEALDAEASGYFLAPAGAGEDESWRAVSDPEASTVWGKGPTNGTIPGDAGDPPANGKPPDCPMCSYDIKESSVSLTLSDTPVGYTPPIGPSARVRLTYNQREANQPQNFNFFNISPKWTLNWLSYVTDDPNNAGASVTRYLPGGGAYYYSGYNGTTGRFAAQFDDGSILVRASGGPISYQRQLSNGGVEVYSQSDGSSGYPRNIFLTQVIDPQGNALTLNYDNQQRLSSLTDATGRQTSFTYGVAGRPLLVSQITDPFGRSATLAYDAFGRLSAITDVIGLTSSFTYDANALVNSMTTPYGTTTFAYTAPGTSAPPRFVQVTDPLGYSEREEWLEPASIPDSDPAATVPQGMPVTLTNQYLTYRNSFHWDKDAYIAANCTPSGGCDYAKARNRHFTHVPNTSLKSTALESVKYPLENRAWYAYLGQTTSIDGGIYNDPVATGRVLDDGTTQLRKVSYDAAGYLNVTQVVDPLGRTTSYAYSNGVDLAAISQTTAYGIQTTVAQFTYNSAHRPIIYTDASGQTTEFSYNAAGQLTSQTNPLNQKTQYQYDGSGNLTSTINANGVTAATLTYDGYARVRTYTDSEGWTATYGYDAANRITKVTYPDGTSETYTYDRLDLASRQDRQSRIWRYSHDANRRLTVIADPEGQQTQLAYNREGQLTGLTDPKGFTTLWIYDVQGRLTSKQYADLSTITYAYEATTSRVKSVTDALGQTKQFSYAKDDRIVGINYLNAVNTTPNVTFAFDPYFPRVISRADGTGTAQFSYVPVGSLGALRMQQEAGASANSTISYAYDELSRLITRTVGGSGAESFQFDTLGRLGTHTSDLGSFVLSYLGQTGQVSTRQLASSNLSTNWSYLGNAGDRRLATISNVGLSPSQFSNYAFTTTPENFIASITETSDTAAAYPTALAQTASFNNLNQLTNLSGQALAYDANGNLISDGTHNYSWDAENRLIRVTYPAQPGKQTLFTYDGRGRRTTVANTSSGGGSSTTTTYIWCSSQLCQARDANNTPIRAYYAEGEFVPGSPAQMFFYGNDQLSSTRRVFASASSAPAYNYDPFGNPLQATGLLTDVGFAGMFYNADSGLYLAQYRAYDPVAGRWLSRDPDGEDGIRFADQQRKLSVSLAKSGVQAASLAYDSPAWPQRRLEEGGPNLYPYGNQNPISNVDPTGRAAAIPAAIGGTIVCGPVCGAVAVVVAVAATAGVIVYEARKPSSARPINETEWSGDHRDIKDSVGAGPRDDVQIDSDGGIWVKQPDGTYTGPEDNGYAGDQTGTGRPSGRRGQDRERRRNPGNCD